MKANRIIAVGGTTGSGKSQLAIELAKKYGGIIVNADSRQIYSELNVGTAKPIPDRITDSGIWYIEDIEHHLFGTVSITTPYNIYNYQKDFNNLLKRYSDTNVFLVGGTGLYIDSVLHGYILPKTHEIPKDLTLVQLQNKLGKQLDELNQSDRQNPRRLITALRNTSSPIEKKLDNYLYLVLDVPKEILNERIDKRVEDMFKNGLLEENLFINKLHSNDDLPSLNTIGYTEFKEYFKNQASLDEVKELIKLHTRQYAKRQRTWFKRNKEIIHIANFEEADYAVGKFLRTL